MRCFQIFTFFLILDNVKFIKHPVSTSSKTTGGSLEISDCEIQSQTPLDKNDRIFYLINNVKIFPAQFVRTSRTIEGIDYLHYSFIPYTRIKTSYKDQGFYQCGITIDGAVPKTVLSKTTDVQFTGLCFI